MRRAAVLVVAPIPGGRSIRAAVGRDEAFELVGVAQTVDAALEAVDRMSPDIVVLDAALGGDACLSLVAALARRRARPAVMSVAGPDDAGPVLRGDTSLVIEHFAHRGRTAPDERPVDDLERELPPRLLALSARARTVRASASGKVPGRGPEVRLLAIGVSTGGPDALVTVLGALPRTLPVPVVVVQHMPAAFVPKLARRLDDACSLDVQEARDGESLLPGTVRIAPAAIHLRVENHYGALVSRLAGTVPENACCPAVDVLFRSAARALGPAALGLVMTGMGRDGYLGSRALVLSGARVVVQDEPSSIVWGMPGIVSRGGLACATVPLDGLADEVLFRLGHPMVDAPRVRVAS